MSLSINYLSIHKKELDGINANYVNLNHFDEEIGISGIFFFWVASRPGAKTFFTGDWRVARVSAFPTGGLMK